jgi:hypothetical protein
MRSPVASSSRNFEGESTTLRSVTLGVADDSEIPELPIGVTRSTLPTGLVNGKFWTKAAIFRPVLEFRRGWARLRSLAYATGKPGMDARAAEMGRVRE